MADQKIALCICSDLLECTKVSTVLEELNLEVRQSVGWRNARQTLADRRLSLIFCEDSLPDGSYRELLRTLKGGPKKVPVIVSAVQADWSDFLQAIQLGAFDLVRRPYRPLELKWVAGNALAQPAWPPVEGEDQNPEPQLPHK